MKITALRDVTILAYIQSAQPQWLSLQAGEVRDGIDIILGVHTTCAPDQPVTFIRQIGYRLVTVSPDEPEPFGLYRRES